MRPTSIQAADFCRMATAQHGGRFHREEERTGGIDQHLPPPSADKRYETCIRTNARVHSRSQTAAASQGAPFRLSSFAAASCFFD